MRGAAGWEVPQQVLGGGGFGMGRERCVPSQHEHVPSAPALRLAAIARPGAPGHRGDPGSAARAAGPGRRPAATGLGAGQPAGLRSGRRDTGEAAETPAGTGGREASVSAS